MYLPPLLATTTVGKPAVEHAHPVEPGLEPRHGLGRKRDLRHEHNPLASRCDHLGQGLQVELRLSAGGDPVEQDRLEPAVIQVRGNGVKRCGLVLRGRRGRRLFRAELKGRVVVNGRFAQRGVARALEGAEDAVIRLGEADHVARRHLAPDGGQHSQHARLAGGPGLDLRRARTELVGAARGGDEKNGARGGLLLDRAGQYRIQGLAPRARIIGGHPARELEHTAVEHGPPVEQLDDILDARRVNRRLTVEANAVADHLATAEGHAHARPRPDRILQGARHAIVKHALHRHVQGHGSIRFRRRFSHTTPRSVTGLHFDDLAHIDSIKPDRHG